MKNIAKYMTLVMLGVAFCVGCVGAFFPSFQMEGFATFLKSFAPIYISLIASIGANSAIKKIQETKKETQ
ncbi:MAG: hypothetical protein ACOWWR_07770 [Eubacteriales bacterium]